MKKGLNYFIFIFLLINSTIEILAQSLPMHRYSINKHLIDLIALKPSFAFSSRKLRRDYVGSALRVRRSIDNAEADIAFDANNVVTDNSIVTIAVSGTSGLALNSTMNLATFRSGKSLFVSIWYDQSVNGFHGVQTNTARQVPYSMGVAGSSNQYPSLVFTGTSKHNVTVNQTIPTLLGSGLRGSVIMVGKLLTSSGSNNSFGHSDVADNTKRWSAHMNWPDNNLYTDFGYATDVSRSFYNVSNLGVFKQYTLYRNATNKTVRVSGVVMLNNVALNTLSLTWSAGSTFGVGLTTGSLDTQFGQNGFTGNIPEFILYPEALTNAEVNLLEENQIKFWGAF
ncbi:hypothetical protein V7S79_00010 [Aquirufa sp. ROCK-SH2]